MPQAESGDAGHESGVGMIPCGCEGLTIEVPVPRVPGHRGRIAMRPYTIAQGRAEGRSPSALLIIPPLPKGDTGGLAFGGQSGGGHVTPHICVALPSIRQ